MSVSLSQSLRIQREVSIVGGVIDLDLLAKAIGVASRRLVDFRVTGVSEEVFYVDDDAAAVNQIRMPGDTFIVTHGALVGGVFVAGNSFQLAGVRAKILKVIDATNIVAWLDLNGTVLGAGTITEETEAGVPTGVTAPWVSNALSPDSVTSPAFLNGTLDYRIKSSKLAVRTELAISRVTITGIKVALMAQDRVL
jgi:hypothetical protein